MIMYLIDPLHLDVKDNLAKVLKSCVQLYVQNVNSTSLTFVKKAPRSMGAWETTEINKLILHEFANAHLRVSHPYFNQSGNLEPQVQWVKTSCTYITVLFSYINFTISYIKIKAKKFLSKSH